MVSLKHKLIPPNVGGVALADTPPNGCHWRKFDREDVVGYVGLVGRTFSQCEVPRTCPFDNDRQAIRGAMAVSVHGNRTGVSSRVFHVSGAAGGRSP